MIFRNLSGRTRMVYSSICHTMLLSLLQGIALHSRLQKVQRREGICRKISQKYSIKKYNLICSFHCKKNIADPDLLAARLSAQESRTQQLQQKYNETLEEYKRKQEEVLCFCCRFVFLLKCDIFVERSKKTRVDSASD